MSPDLTDLQLISLGIAIAMATTFTTVLILTLIYAEEIRRRLQRLGLLRGRRILRTDWGTAPFPSHYVVPRFEQRRRPTIRTDLASVSTTTTTHSLHRRTITIRDPSSNEYYSSREELPTPHDTELDRRRSLTPAIEDPGTSAWHIRAAQATADPWGDAVPSNTANDPDYPAGSWNAGDAERARAQNEQNTPDPFAADNVYIEDKHIDASPPYITRNAMAAPRSRAGPHSPNYSHTDPFAALQ